MDTVFIHDLTFPMLIGIHPHERRQPQRVSVDLELLIDAGRAARSEEIGHTVDYETVSKRIMALGASRHFPLVEAFAATVAEALEQDFGLDSFDLRIGKTDVLHNAAAVGVRIRRGRLAP